MAHEVKVEVGGRQLILETGKMARQANGAVMARYGDTTVLATACMDSKPTEKDFLPLTVDYREYTYSAGKIPGGFFKREGRPSEREILTSRLTDRPLRPLFPEGWSTETQIVSMVLSADSENDPDVIGVTAASAALCCSNIPFDKPIAAVRVGLLNGQLVVNPTVADQKTSLLNIVVAGTDEAIVMVEAGSLEVSEETVVDALAFGHEQIRRIIAAIRELHALVRPQKVAVPPVAFDENLARQIEQQYGARLRIHSTRRSIRSSRVTAWSPRCTGRSSTQSPKRTRTSASWLRAPLSAFASVSSARILSGSIAVPTRGPSTRFARLLARSACCRARTARRFSPAVRRRRSARSRWERRKISSGSTCCSKKSPSSASCCITISRRSASER